MSASEELMEAVLTELPSEVAVLDDEASIVYTNQTWRRFAEKNGLAGDPASLGQNYLDVCDASPDSETAREAADGIRSLLAGESQEFSMEYPCYSPDECRYFSTNAERFRHDGDTCVLWVHLDVTDRRTAEERVRAQNERLENVASVLSHDLKDPLNVAAGYVDLLVQSDGSDNEGESETVTRIRPALGRMNAILDDALSLALRTDVGETERVALRTAAKRVWANVRTDGASLDVTDTFEFEADASLFDNLFENLFRNAVERRGGGVTVRVGPLADGFYVEDDGPGIPPDVRDEAFDAGFTTGDGAENTGLDLAIVDSIADSHGWDVRATEGRDGGARFEVRT